MSNHASESSLPVLSHADGFAASASDALLLVGRVLLGWLFLTSAWGKLPHSDSRFCHPLCRPRVSPLPHRRHRARPPLLGISGRPGDGPVQQLPQESCALRRHLGVVRDRCGPLQCRSNAVEEGLSRGGLVWRFRSPHHFCSQSEMRTSDQSHTRSISC